jgi:putative flippase GtrA
MSALSSRPVQARPSTSLGAASGTLLGRLTSMGAFGAVGVSGIAVNQLMLAALVSRGHANYLVAAVAASVGSTSSNFVLTELWVFRKRRRPGALPRFIGYLALTLASTPVRLPILYVLTSLHGVHYLVSNLVAIFAIFGARFLVSDLLIWRPRATAPQEVHATE